MATDATQPPPESEEQSEEQDGPVLRPLVSSGLSAVAAGLAAGGVFGSWAARGIGVSAAALGVVWAGTTVRQRRASVALQALTFPIAGTLAVASLVPDSDPARLPTLVREAVTSGRLLKPPVPFDPGWRPLLIVFLFAVGFGAAMVAVSWQRPQLGIALPLPVLGMTAISQPPETEVVGGVISLVLILLALAALYGGDLSGASELTSQFELRRAVRGLVVVVPLIVVLLTLSRGNFLFPEPRYNPAAKPQKPKAVPLSEVQDRVLFEVRAPDRFTGPWRTGVLDSYDGSAWRLPPVDDARLTSIPADGVVDRTREPTLTVRFTTRELGDAAVLPGTVNPSAITVHTPGVPVRFDTRAEVFRLPSGRVEPGTVYEIGLPPYPGEVDLRAAPAASGVEPELLYMPRAPKPVEDLLSQAPENPWDRLEFLRTRLYSVAVAKGAGLTGDVPPQRVQEILVGDHEASPYELVATEAMLARWAGIPARIGFGFDGFNEEDDVLTVRPRNGSSWLEVWFEGFGWVPLIASPQQAKASLSADPTARFNIDIRASEDIAIEVYLPIKLENALLLYEIVRHYVGQGLPWMALGVAAYLAWPALLRAVRRSRRRRWAAQLGPGAQIAVEYAEFRDLATDLGVGDPYATPIEYLDRVQEDARHEELAWLVSRCMYGDLVGAVTDEDALAAARMSESLRRRLDRAQPFTSRVLARVGRASLKTPYTTEVPSIGTISLPRVGRRKSLSRAGRGGA